MQFHVWVDHGPGEMESWAPERAGSSFPGDKGGCPKARGLEEVWGRRCLPEQ